MSRKTQTPVRLIGLALLVGAFAAVLLLAGCKASNEPITEPGGGFEGTGTVQAPLPGETSTVTATSTTSPTSSVSTTSSVAASVWPKKVGSFAKAEKKMPVWYPKTLPKGFKIETLDVVELDKGTGLICDIMWLKGEVPIFFTQGSPTGRRYDVVSSERVPWGDETADVTRVDPSDSASPQVIVYSKGGNFAELSGEVTLDQLKAIAASMVRVR